MIGLKKEIMARKSGIYLGINEPVSYLNIAKIINKPYTTVKRRIDNGTLTAQEAIEIYNGLNFKAKDNFDAFQYLFTEQGD